MGEVKQIDNKNRSYYIYNDIINLENVNARLLKIDKKTFKGINIYYIGYITKIKIDYCQNTYSVNPLYLRIDHANRYIEEKNGNKYLVFDSVDENKKLLKNAMMLGMELRTKSKK